MDVYQHDSGGSFRLVVRGRLAGDPVRELEQAWKTAQSILERKELIVDISGVSMTDQQGFDLLSRMRDSGARVIPALPLEFAEAVFSSDIRQLPGGEVRLFRRLLQAIRGASGMPKFGNCPGK